MRIPCMMSCIRVSANLSHVASEKDNNMIHKNILKNRLASHCAAGCCWPSSASSLEAGSLLCVKSCDGL